MHGCICSLDLVVTVSELLLCTQACPELAQLSHNSKNTETEEACTDCVVTCAETNAPISRHLNSLNNYDVDNTNNNNVVNSLNQLQ